LRSQKIKKRSEETLENLQLSGHDFRDSLALRILSSEGRKFMAMLELFAGELSILEPKLNF